MEQLEYNLLFRRSYSDIERASTPRRDKRLSGLHAANPTRRIRSEKS